MAGNGGNARGYAHITIVIIITVLCSEAKESKTKDPPIIKEQKTKDPPIIKEQKTKDPPIIKEQTENKPLEKRTDSKNCNNTIYFSSVCKKNQTNPFSCETDTKFTYVDDGVLSNVTIYYKDDMAYNVYGGLNVTKTNDTESLKKNRTVLVDCYNYNVSVVWGGTRMTISRNNAIVNSTNVPSNDTDSGGTTAGVELPFNVLVICLVAVCCVGILTLMATMGVAIKHVTSGDQRWDDKGLEAMWVPDTHRVEADYDPMIHQPQSVFLQGDEPDQRVEHHGSNPNLAADGPPLSPPPPPPPPAPPSLPPSPPLSAGPNMIYADLELEEPCAKDFVLVPRQVGQTEYVTIDFNTKKPCLVMES